MTVVREYHTGYHQNETPKTTQSSMSSPVRVLTSDRTALPASRMRDLARPALLLPAPLPAYPARSSRSARPRAARFAPAMAPPTCDMATAACSGGSQSTNINYYKICGACTRVTPLHGRTLHTPHTIPTRPNHEHHGR